MSLLNAVREADVVIVGAGFFGATVAERVANELGRRVVVIDRRPHIGGNSWSERYAGTDIEVHRYGSHIFHTSNERVWNYVNKFTAFNDYRHHVIAVHRGQAFSMPINLGTIASFLGRVVTPAEAQAWIESNRPVGVNAQNLEDHAIAQIGQPLYEAFIKGYTRKQWQTDPRSLPKEVIQRLPVRLTFDGRYFSDRWEGIPLEGYGAVFRKMLNSELISSFVSVDFDEVREHIDASQLVIFTGPIDAYFRHEEGVLGWRTVDLEYEVLEVNDYQGTSVVNYVDLDVQHTRIHEFKHFHPERNSSSDHTVIAREFSRSAGPRDDPYYPINSSADREILERYRSRAKSLKNTLFGGRLGSYQYLDMHMAIASALQCFEDRVRPWIVDGTR